MTEFRVGDRVEAIIDAPDENYSIHAGDLGTVCKAGWIIGVRWDRPVDNGHDCGGTCEYGYGWNMLTDQIALYEEEAAEDIDEVSFLGIALHTGGGDKA